MHSLTGRGGHHRRFYLSSADQSADQVWDCGNHRSRVVFVSLFGRTGLRKGKRENFETISVGERRLPHATKYNSHIRRLTCLAKGDRIREGSLHDHESRRSETRFRPSRSMRRAAVSIPTNISPKDLNG